MSFLHNGNIYYSFILFKNIYCFQSNLLITLIYPKSIYENEYENELYKLLNSNNTTIDLRNFNKINNYRTSHYFDNNIYHNYYKTIKLELFDIEPIRYLWNNNRIMFAGIVLLNIPALLFRRSNFFVFCNCSNFCYNLSYYKKIRE